MIRSCGSKEAVEGERVIKRIYRSRTEGERTRKRPRNGYIDGVKAVLGHRGISIEEGERHVWDKESGCIQE